MSRVDGLIIPRSYNDYYSRSDTAAMREVIAQNTDSSLSSVSEMPVQNKVVKSALDAAEPVDSVADGEMKPPTSNAVHDAIAPIMASTTTISGPALATNGSVLIMFTDNIAGTDGTTPLAITYNGTSIPVKAHSGGSLVDVTAKEIAASTFRYLDKYTSLQMVFDGTNFVIVGNPVVLSGTDYTIYADGKNGFVDDWTNVTSQCSALSGFSFAGGTVVYSPSRKQIKGWIFITGAIGNGVPIFRLPKKARFSWQFLSQGLDGNTVVSSVFVAQPGSTDFTFSENVLNISVTSVYGSFDSLTED